MARRTKKPPRTEVYVVVRVEDEDAGQVPHLIARALEELAEHVRGEAEAGPLTGGEFVLDASLGVVVEVDVVTPADRAAWRDA